MDLDISFNLPDEDPGWSLAQYMGELCGKWKRKSTLKKRVWFITPQPPVIIKATPRSSATMDDTPEFPVVMDVKQEFPVVSSVVFGDNKAFSRRLRLASSLADPPLRSVRAAGIPRPSTVEVLEVVPLSAVLPVMAVAMLCLTVQMGC